MLQMRRLRAGLLVLGALAVAGPALAQDVPNPDELKKQYDEAVEQLKAAQDRKSELAAENEKLQARIADLERRLSERDREVAGFAERTWYYRAQYAAWQRFIERYPQMKQRWMSFLEAGALEGPSRPPLMSSEGSFQAG
jgi:predicted nuclease with TOPRIM domain